MTVTLTISWSLVLISGPAADTPVMSATLVFTLEAPCVVGILKNSTSRRTLATVPVALESHRHPLVPNTYIYEHQCSMVSISGKLCNGSLTL